MAYNEELALRIRAAMGGEEGVVERKMFGGIAFMLKGNMSVGVTGDDLMVRVGPMDWTTPCLSPMPGPWILPDGL